MSRFSLIPSSSTNFFFRRMAEVAHLTTVVSLRRSRMCDAARAVSQCRFFGHVKPRVKSREDARIQLKIFNFFLRKPERFRFCKKQAPVIRAATGITDQFVFFMLPYNPLHIPGDRALNVPPTISAVHVEVHRMGGIKTGALHG